MSVTNQIIGGSFQDFEGNLLSAGYLIMELSQDAQITTDAGQICGKIKKKIPLDANGDVVGTIDTFVLTSVDRVGTTSVCIYTGTISGGDDNAYAGLSFVISGFLSSGNNGNFTVRASTATTLEVTNSSGVDETHSGSASFAGIFIWPNDVIVPSNTFYAVWGYKSNGQLAWGPNYQQVDSSPSPFDLDTWVPNDVNTSNPGSSVLFQVDGVDVTDQTLINFVPDTNMTITNPSAGNIVFASSGGGGGGLTLYDNSGVAYVTQKAQSGQANLDGGGSRTITINATVYNASLNWGAVATDQTAANPIQAVQSSNTIIFTGTPGDAFTYLIFPVFAGS